MKFDYIGCCFRITIELYRRTMAIRRYRIVARPTAVQLRRKMLREVMARLKQQRCEASHDR